MKRHFQKFRDDRFARAHRYIPFPIFLTATLPNSKFGNLTKTKEKRFSNRQQKNAALAQLLLLP